MLVSLKLNELDRRVGVVGIKMEGEGIFLKNIDLLLEFGEDDFSGFEV